MRLLYLASIRLPTEKAHGIQIMETCAALTRNGVDVTLVVPYRDNMIKTELFDYYNITTQFPLHVLTTRDYIEWGRFGYFLNMIQFVYQTLRYIRSLPPGETVLYCRDIPIVFALSLWKPKNTQLFWEAHGVTSQWIVKKIVPRVNGLITITNGLKKWYIALGADESRVLVAHDAVSLEHYCQSPLTGDTKNNIKGRYQIPQGPMALYLGRIGFYLWKGPDVALSAARLAPEIQWVFVGGFEDSAQSLVQSLPSNVTIVPRVQRIDISALVQSADVLLLPNKSGDPASELYTSPMKLFEYMASGVPIVASRLPSIVEVLSDESAYLVTPNDPEALLDGVRQSMQQIELSQSRAETARSCVNDYTWDKRAQHIQTFIISKQNHL